MTRPVKVFDETGDPEVEGSHIYECDTVADAEEWIAENYAPDKQDGIRIVATDEALAANADIAINPESTEVPPAPPPANDLQALHGMLSRLLDCMDDASDGAGDLCMEPGPEADALEAARRDAAVLVDTDIPASTSNPLLAAFDEAVTAGRAELIRELGLVDDGKLPPAILPHFRVMGGLKAGDVDGLPFLRPVTTTDLIRIMRDNAAGIVHVLGQTPFYFLIPGLKQMIEKLNEVSSIPTIDEYASGARSLPDDMRDLIVSKLATHGDYAAGQGAVHLDLQPGALV